VNGCSKSYLYYSSLKKHIRLAHPEIYHEKIASNQITMSDCLAPDMRALKSGARELLQRMRQEDAEERKQGEVSEELSDEGDECSSEEVKLPVKRGPSRQAKVEKIF
jgi:hypothetical protein